MTTGLVDAGILLVWGGVAGYFVHRFFAVTRKPVTLSLAVASGCVSFTGIADSFSATHAAVRWLLLLSGVFTVASLVRIHRQH